MSGYCCANNDTIIPLAGSGGSNVGQLSNRAAVEITQEGFDKMFCLACIGGQLSGFAQPERDVVELLVIDGCQAGCAKAIPEPAKVPMENYLVLTELGIEKHKNLGLKTKGVSEVKDDARRCFG